MPSSILENVDGLIPAPATAVENAPRLQPRRGVLKDGTTRVTVVPVANGPKSIPVGLVECLHRSFSAEIERGCTYPMEEPMTLDKFAEYWFGAFAVVVLVDGSVESGSAISSIAPNGASAAASQAFVFQDGTNWEQVCLGSFYIKPNYPGRCSHVCNAGFLTTAAARGNGVGMAMGEAYLDYAPKLGYKYSVFNLVFANNPASIRIWDRLGFSVIGRVPRAARLANSDELVDALIFGKELA